MVINEFINYEHIIHNVDHSWDTILFELLDCDVILNPPISSPYAKYKSKNKTYLAWALGLPVAHNLQELARFLDEGERKEEGERVYNLVREKYDVKQSVTEYKKLIKEIWEKKK